MHMYIWEIFDPGTIIDWNNNIIIQSQIRQKMHVIELLGWTHSLCINRIIASKSHCCRNEIEINCNRRITHSLITFCYLGILYVYSLHHSEILYAYVSILLVWSNDEVTARKWVHECPVRKEYGRYGEKGWRRDISLTVMSDRHDLDGQVHSV